MQNSGSSLTSLVQEKLKHYQPRLTVQELEKAKSELNEHTPEVRNHSICSLSRSIEHNCSQQFLSQFLPQISEPTFLLRFLRASKFRPEKALSRLTKWLKFYSKTEPSWPELSNVLNNPESSGLLEFMKSYNPIYVCPAAGKNVPGAWVMITDPPSLEFPGGLEKYVVFVAAQMIYTFDKLLTSESLQVHGIYTLTDSSKTNKNNTKFILKPHLLKKLTGVLVGMPVRQKGDISVNTNIFYKMLIKAISGVLPKKTRDRFVQLGKVSDLQNILRVELLTKNYNGYKTDQECLGYFGMPSVTLNTQLSSLPVKSNNSPINPSVNHSINPPMNLLQSSPQSNYASNPPSLPPRPTRPPAPQSSNNPPTTDDLISF